MAEQNEQNQDQDANVSILINAQYVKDLSLENPNAPKSLTQQEQAPDVSVNIDVGAQRLNEESYEVVLVIKSEAKQGEETSFLVELSYAGIFTLQNIPEDALEPFLLIECPRMLFPFARSVVANATRDAGFPPLLINPIDFASLYRAQKEAAAAQAGEEQAEASAE